MIKIQLEDMQRKCSDKEKRAEDASDEFVKFKYEVATDAINSRSGKQIPPKDLEQYQVKDILFPPRIIVIHQKHRGNISSLRDFSQILLRRKYDFYYPIMYKKSNSMFLPVSHKYLYKTRSIFWEGVIMILPNYIVCW